MRRPILALLLAATGATAALPAAAAATACPPPAEWAARFHREHAGFTFEEDPAADALLSPELAARIAAERAYAQGEVGHLDYDPWLGAQDGGMAAAPAFVLEASTATTATVAMRYPFALEPHGPHTPHEVRLLLVHGPDHCWRLDDLVTPRGDSLSTLFATQEPHAGGDR